MENILNRLSRLAPLTGVVFAILGAAGFMSGQGPGSTTDGAKIAAFFVANSTGQQVSDILWALAFAFLVLFAGSLRSYLRRTPVAEGLSSVVLAGAAMMAVGAFILFGCDYALAVGSSHLAPAAAQAVSLIENKLSFPLAAGGLVFGIASGLAILRGAQLPKWLGWLALASGIAMLAAGIFGLFVYFVWTAIASVLVWKRSGVDTQALRAVSAVTGEQVPAIDGPA